MKKTINMKKFILSILIVFIVGFANAQAKKKISFGVKGGLNIATLTGDVEDASSLIGFQIGGFAEIERAEIGE